MEYSPPREEGWLRHQENAGEAHLSAADGVVAHKSSSGVSDDFLDGCALAGLRGLRPPPNTSSAVSAVKHHPDAVSRTQGN